VRAAFGVLPVAGIKPVICRRGNLAADAEQRAESVERVEPAVKPERELVEVGLKVLRRDAVVAALQPAFEVAENKMDDWQKFLGDSRVASLNDSRETPLLFGVWSRAPEMR
jgi:hypothetical protein